MRAEQAVFVLADAAKCSGCRACELACFANHAMQEGGVKSAKKRPQTVGCITEPVIPGLFLARAAAAAAGTVAAACMPVQCHHCEDAPCIKACLCGAIGKVDGTVLIDSRRCIGCRNCALACPFGAIEVFSIAELGGNPDGAPLVYKCDLCTHSVTGEPACVAVCPHEALRLVDLERETELKRIGALEAGFSAASCASINVCGDAA
jgi:electron transport protein HydN